MEQITYDDFAKIEFRIGQIVEAEKVEGSEKLLKTKVDFGEFGIKQVFSGIYKWYKPEDLIGKKTVYIVNMIPKKIMGEMSEAMIFAAESEDGETISILLLEKDLPNGSRVF